jgi:hypothetical protein
MKGSFEILSQQIESLHKDLLAFQAKTMQRFDKIEGRLDDRGRDSLGKFRKIDGHLDGIQRELRGLRADIPKIVRNAMRDVLGKRRSKS